MFYNWNDVRLFLAVSRAKSFVAAAAHLKMTHSTVSRRIAALESALVTQLFLRSEKGCRLTAAGEQLLPLAEALEHAACAFQAQVSNQDKQLSGIIRIGSPDGLGNCFLAPRLGTFQQQNPQLEVELIAVPMYYSLHRREVDILISLRKPTAGKVIGQRITTYKFGLFATPDYLDHAPPLNDIQDLAKHCFVGYIEDLMYDQRLRFLEDFQTNLHTSFRSSTIIAQMNALKAGVGIGVLPYFMAHTEPTLVSVLPEHFIEREFWLQANPDSRQLTRVGRTIDFIIEAMRSQQELFVSLPSSTLSPQPDSAGPET